MLIPISLVVALLFVQQGVIQNFKPYLEVTTLEGAKQVLAMGPVASQEIIKQLGTNGAASSMPTLRIRLKTRRRGQTSGRCLPSL